MKISATDKAALVQLAEIHAPTDQNFVALGPLKNEEGKNRYIFLDADHCNHKKLKRNKHGNTTRKIPRDRQTCQVPEHGPGRNHGRSQDVQK